MRKGEKWQGKTQRRTWTLEQVFLLLSLSFLAKGLEPEKKRQKQAKKRRGRMGRRM